MSSINILHMKIVMVALQISMVALQCYELSLLHKKISMCSVLRSVYYIRSPSLCSIYKKLHFSPRKGKTSKLDEYVEAETRGMNEGRCEEVYGSCPLSVRKLMPEQLIQKAMMKKKKK